MPRPQPKGSHAIDLKPLERFRARIQAGRERAESLGRPVLVSTVEAVPLLDALQVLAGGGGPRTYWAVPREEFALACAGAAVELAPSGDARFREAAREWACVLADALTDGDRPPATGPLLAGGFSFAARGRPDTTRWREFGEGNLEVPRVMVTQSGARCWLTLNALVEADTDVRRTVDLTAALLEEIAAADRPAAAPEADAGALADHDDPAAFKAKVRDAVAAIRAGGFEKVVLARELRVSLPRDPDIAAAVRHLRDTHADRFVFAFRRGESVFFGASPERLARVRDGEVRTSVLAGSASRGETLAEDAALAAALLSSAKDRAEHDIVRRDLERAVGAVCDEVHIDSHASLVSLPNVHHLHTSVRARLARGRSVFDVIERLHPTPAVGGSPRDAALAYLDAHEGVDRGWYAGPVGWVDATGAEFAVALRCALVRGAEASLFAGCGIVAASDPDDEYEESRVKLRPALEALAAATAVAEPAPAGAQP